MKKTEIINGITKIHYGGSNTRNISYLNMKNFGDFYALNSVPPDFYSKETFKNIIEEARGWVSEIKNGLVITNHLDSIFEFIVYHSYENKELRNKKTIRKLSKLIYRKIIYNILKMKDEKEKNLLWKKFNTQIKNCIKNIKYLHTAE